MAMPRSWMSSSKTPRNSEPLSVWPSDDDQEGLEDALEGPRMLRAERMVTSAAAVGFAIGSQTAS